MDEKERLRLNLNHSTHFLIFMKLTKICIWLHEEVSTQYICTIFSIIFQSLEMYTFYIVLQIVYIGWDFFLEIEGVHFASTLK
jgi:hypothetical protein